MLFGCFFFGYVLSDIWNLFVKPGFVRTFGEMAVEPEKFRLKNVLKRLIFVCVLSGMFANGCFLNICVFTVIRF